MPKSSPPKSKTAAPPNPPPPHIVEDEAYIQYVALDDVIEWERNPKAHDVDEIERSINRFGFVAPGIVNETSGVLVAGHGRARALKKLKEAGAAPPRRVRVGPGGEWLLPIIRGIRFNSDAEAEAYTLADNRLTETGGWNDAMLAEVLATAANRDGGLVGTGFGREDLEAILERVKKAEEDGDDEPTSDGSLLALTGVTVGEPRHTVQKGEKWRVGRHILYIGDIFTDWRYYVPLLSDGDLFVPYPGPFIPITHKADDPTYKIVMVQPDPYIAGHLLDQYENINGPLSVERMNP